MIRRTLLGAFLVIVALSLAGCALWSSAETAPDAGSASQPNADAGASDAGSSPIDCGATPSPSTCADSRGSDACATCSRGHCIPSETTDALTCVSGFDPPAFCGAETAALEPGTGGFDAPFVYGAGLRLPDEDGPLEIVACEDGFVWELRLGFIPGAGADGVIATVSVGDQRFSTDVDDIGPLTSADRVAWTVRQGVAELCLPFGTSEATAQPPIGFGVQLRDTAGRRSERTCGSLASYIPVPGAD